MSRHIPQNHDYYGPDETNAGELVPFDPTQAQGPTANSGYTRSLRTPTYSPWPSTTTGGRSFGSVDFGSTVAEPAVLSNYWHGMGDAMSELPHDPVIGPWYAHQDANAGGGDNQSATSGNSANLDRVSYYCPFPECGEPFNTRELCQQHCNTKHASEGRSRAASGGQSSKNSEKHKKHQKKDKSGQTSKEGLSLVSIFPSPRDAGADSDPNSKETMRQKLDREAEEEREKRKKDPRYNHQKYREIGCSVHPDIPFSRLLSHLAKEDNVGCRRLKRMNW